MIILRFLALVLILNVLRYSGGFVLEQFIIFPGLFGAMAESASYFRTEYTAFDWTTSYLYNFLMWMSCVWIFHLARPAIRGSDLVASCKIFGILWLMYASTSAIYMNHYSHPRDFYVWSILDAAIVFALVAIGNGLLYRRIMGTCANSSHR